MTLRIATLLILTTVLPVALPVQTAAMQSAPVAGTCLYFDGVHAAQEDVEERVERRLDKLVASGFNSVCIAFPFYMEEWTSSQVSYREDFVPTRDELGKLIEGIRGRGMSVGLKPILEETSLVSSGPAGTWRGTITPDDPAAWFSSYTELLVHYSELAAQYPIAWLAIGTEFNSLEAPEYDSYWIQLIKDLRAVTSRDEMQLLYSQNFDMVPAAPAWFGELNMLAIDAYFPLEGVGDDASIDELIVAMASHRWKIEQLREQYPGKPLYITEIGVSSVNGVYQAPYLWGEASESPVNLETQARYAAAACEFYTSDEHQVRLADGMYWWFVTINPPDDPLQDKGFEFIGKPAQDQIERCNERLVG